MRIDYLQAMNFIMMAWHNTSPKIIENCFAHDGFFLMQLELGDPFLSQENWTDLSVVSSFEEFVECDYHLATSSFLTVEEMNEIDDSSRAKKKIMLR